MEDGGVGEGTAGRMAPLVDISFRRQCSSGTFNGLRRIANRQKKQELTMIPEAKQWEYS